MVILAPIVKLDAKETFDVFRAVPIKFIVVRLQDLISKRTYGFNKSYYDIIDLGSLHDFLHFHGHILLSLIMKDEIIANFRPSNYVTALASLIPDSCTTIDGETYEGEYSLSLKEIERIHAENKELVKLYPKCRYIGLVKGCTESQIKYHINLLKSLGIEDFVFHIGDFFRYGDPNMIRKARSLSYSIRQNTNNLLMLYGMGSQERLSEFSFADVFISFKHFVTAKNGMKFIGTKQIKYTGGYDSKILLNNFIQMYKNVESLKKQVKLN